MSGDEPERFLATAHAMADAAGAVARRHFRTTLAVDDKADSTPVTLADREAEQAMRAVVARDWPGHGVLGEEFGRDRAGASHLWVLDPIDGTKSFVCGIPLFGTLIALLVDGRPVLGIIDQPILGERWAAARGRGTTLNGTAVHTRRAVALGDARLFTTSPDMFAGPRAEAYARLRAAVKLTRFGTDCYGAGLLATGHGDLFVEGQMQPYDYAALIPVIEEAGGVMTDWQGAPLTLESDGFLVAAGDPPLHRQALDALDWR